MREYPEGRLNGDDDGAIEIALGVQIDKKVVVIDFMGKSVTWLALEKEYAIAFANSLLEKAKELPD